MFRTRRATQVPAAAIATWVLVTAFLVVWLLSLVLPDASSHLAQDAAFFGTLVIAPLVVLALVGLVVLNALPTTRTGPTGRRSCCWACRSPRSWPTRSWP